MPEEKTVLDAVNDALGDQIAPTETGEAETPEPEVPEGDEPEGETPEGDEPEGETPEGEKEPEQGPNGERERNADGTWKKVEAAKVDKDGKSIVEPKKADPVNDPIPKDL